MIEQLLDGRYQITQVLAKGGFGQTYLAVDTRRPGHPVCVVKQLRPNTNDPQILPTIQRLFNAEAEILEKLGQNDQIPRLLAYFDEKQEFYLVQEFIPGHPLSQEVVPRQPLNTDQVIRLLTDVLEILVFVHSQGVIHRDIKPANIIRRQPDHKLVLIDFGTVKQISTVNALGEPNVTVAVGTPTYMPIEQFHGYPQLNSDIYAVGVIGIQAASGLSAEEIRTLINPNRPNAGIEHWRDHCSIDSRLAAILDKMVHFDYRQRYQSALSVLSDLKDFDSSLNNSDTIAATTPNAVPSLTVSSSSSQVLEPLQTGVTPISAAIPKRRKLSPWLLIGGGIAIALVGGVHHLPHLMHLPIVQTTLQNDSAPNLSLARTLIGHSDSVWSVALSVDGRTLVSGSQDNTIKIWNPNTGQLNRTIEAHSDSLRSVGISLDGQMLFSASGDGTVKVWNTQTGELRYTLTGHPAPVWSVALSRDGQTLVSGSEDKTIKVWNLQTGQLVRTLSGHSAPVYSVALSPNGQTLASGSADNTIKVWNLQTGELLRTLQGHASVVRSVVLSPDGRTVASASWDKTIKVWNLQTGELLRTLAGHSDRVVSVTFSSDGRTLASASIDRTIKIWNAQTGELLQSLSGHSDWVLSVATSGRTVVSSSRDKTIKIWQ